MAATPLVPRLFSWRAADPMLLHKLIEGTGSNLDPAGVALYGRLMRSPNHAAGALGMMANWDLHALSRDLARMTVPVKLVVGSADRTISPRQAPRVQALLPQAVRQSVATLAGLGHLAHEERPGQVAEIVLAALDAGEQAKR